jgi:hypothetical protein
MPLSWVSISTDLTLPLIPPCITWHDFAYVTPALTGTTMCFEMPVTIMWPPGFALAQNKLSTTVLHKMMPIALDGHNCGYMIPHVTIPPAPLNTLLVFQILLSSRKMVFAATTVKANGQQIACNLFVLLPMTCCANPVTLPNGTAITNLANNVEVGLSWMDVLAGWLNIAITMIADKLVRSKTGPSVPKLDSKALFERFVLPLTAKNWTNFAIKSVAGLVTGGVRILLTGEGALSIKTGTDYATVGLGFTKTKDGAWSVSASGQVGAPLPPGIVVAVASKYEYKHNPDGSTSSTLSASASEGQVIGPGGAAAKQSASGSHTTDARGTPGHKVTTGSQVVAAEPGAGHQSNETTTTTRQAGKPTKRETSRVEGSRLLGDSWGEPL